MVYDGKLKKQAESLRQSGKSLSDISERLRVPKSTLSLWCRDIPFVPNSATERRIALARARATMTKRARRLESSRMIDERAARDIGELSQRDLFMLGLGIYVGEGSRMTDVVRVIEADPRTIRFAIRWLKEICGLSTENLTLSVHCARGTDIHAATEFWSKETGIPLSLFGKTQAERRKTKNGPSRTTFGTAHLTVKTKGDDRFGVKLARLIEAWKSRALN